jgi:hypothetical protein
MVDSLEAIYLTSRGREAQLYADRNTSRPVEVLAKPGYAVGGLTADGEDRLNGFRVHFMKIEGPVLDPADSYESAWIGGEHPEFRKELGGTGQPVVGLAVGSGADIDALGLVLTAP